MRRGILPSRRRGGVVLTVAVGALTAMAVAAPAAAAAAPVVRQGETYYTAFYGPYAFNDCMAAGNRGESAKLWFTFSCEDGGHYDRWDLYVHWTGSP